MIELKDGYRGVPVAILGATGFIGRWVASALCAQGARLHLVVRSRAAAETIFPEYGIRGEIIESDLGETAKVTSLLQNLRPSITFSLAAYGVDRSEQDEETGYRINAHLVRAVCESAASKRNTDWPGQNIIHVGSAAEYGSLSGNLAEDSIPQPNSWYGRSKLAGTRSLAECCENYRLKGLTVRLFTIYGPGEHYGRLLPSLIESARTGKPVQLSGGTQKRDFTYVEDVVKGLLRLGLGAAKPGEIVNLATGKLTSVREFAETAAGIMKISRDQLKFGTIPKRADEMDHSVVNIERLRRLIGWTPPTEIAEGIGKTLEFRGIHGSVQKVS